MSRSSIRKYFVGTLTDMLSSRSKDDAFEGIYRKLMSPECDTEEWWNLAEQIPLVAVESPLYDILTLEDPGRWHAKQAQYAGDWIRNYIEFLPLLVQRQVLYLALVQTLPFIAPTKKQCANYPGALDLMARWLKIRVSRKQYQHEIESFRMPKPTEGLMGRSDVGYYTQILRTPWAHSVKDNLATLHSFQASRLHGMARFQGKQSETKREDYLVQRDGWLWHQILNLVHGRDASMAGAP